MNSFDGINVGLFDIEGYSKPHVRAQSYLAGIYVALLPPSPPSPNRSKTTKTTTTGGLSKNIQMIFALMGLIILSFITVTGAYARRACTFEESPSLGDDCGTFDYYFDWFGCSVSCCVCAVYPLIFQVLLKNNWSCSELEFFCLLFNVLFSLYLAYPYNLKKKYLYW